MPAWLVPHSGEIALMVLVILLIVGVGRLPQPSRRIARWSLPAEPQASESKGAKEPEHS